MLTVLQNLPGVIIFTPVWIFFLQRSVNPCTAQHHVRDKFLCCRRQERLWRQYNWQNPLVSPLVHFRGQERDGPVTQ